MPTPSFFSFWSINGPLDQQRLRQQLRELQRCGFDGVVFHPRFYPGVPPYLSAGYLADRRDAPEATCVRAWHFKPVRPPRQVVVQCSAGSWSAG